MIGPGSDNRVDKFERKKSDIVLFDSFLFFVSPYILIYFKGKSGALAHPDIWKATPNVDQGLMVLIDRNLDRY